MWKFLTIIPTKQEFIAKNFKLRDENRCPPLQRTKERYKKIIQMNNSKRVHTQRAKITIAQTTQSPDSRAHTHTTHSPTPSSYTIAFHLTNRTLNSHTRRKRETKMPATNCGYYMKATHNSLFYELSCAAANHPSRVATYDSTESRDRHRG